MNVERRYVDEERGHALFSKTFIKSKSIIFEEEPLVCSQFAWNAAYGYKACEFCLMPLETAQENAQRLTGNPTLILPQPQCCTTRSNEIVSCNSCDATYCSQACLLKALNQYHQVLCKQTKAEESHPLDILLEAWKNIHYPPETSTIMLIVKIIATIAQAANREDTEKQFLRFCHKSSNESAQLAHKFLGDKYAHEIGTLNQLLVKALPSEGVESWLSPNGFQSLLALIGTNEQGVGTSSFSQWVNNVSALSISDEEKEELNSLIDRIYDEMDACTGTEFLNNEGVALYSMQSTCNHSCVPNAEASFLHNNSTLSLVALKDIQEGEEICISYLDECLLNRSRHTRQKELKENYLFMCSCEKCLLQSDDPDETSEDEMSE